MNKLIKMTFGLLLLTVAFSGCVSDSAAQDQDEVVARIGQLEITLDDLETTWNEEDPRGRNRMLQELYEAKLQSLNVLVGNHLIDREASARGISRQELLDQEIPARTTPVTDEEVDLLYEQNKGRLGGRTLEEGRPEIRTALEQQRPIQALRRFMDELRDAAEDVVLTLDPPRQKVEVSDGDRSKGPQNAPVVIVEFSDFECPYCQRATETLNELLTRYPDEIRFIYKDFPLPNHPNAFKAAEAGHCANDQGKFWQFHDILFERQEALDIESLKTYAGELGLDVNVFSTCLEESRHADSVNEDMSVARSYGTSSTPTLFINGRPVFGAMPLEVFDQIVREELETFTRQ